MEMDLVAHCGDVNRGSFIHSLVLTDIASGWTEAAPLVVRESGLVVETLDRIREGLPFALRALDVDNGSEFVNERLIRYCLGHGIELTRSRPYRKNDQAWIEQKNGAVVRKLLGYRRFERLADARTMTRLHGAARLFVNFFQPSFKLAEKHREGARVFKRYHPPQTPCERLLQSPDVPEAAKEKLREVSGSLDPLQLLEEIRAVQAQLAALADGEKALPEAEAAPDLQAFLGSLTSAWRSGKVRPTYAADAKPRYLRSLQAVTRSHPIEEPKHPVLTTSSAPDRPSVTYAKPGSAKVSALTMVWPLVCRRLEGAPDINCQQLFEELCLQFPGRFTRWQYKRLVRQVKVWREDARARGVVIGRRRWRKLGSRSRSRRCRLFDEQGTEMTQHLQAHPDQTALELLIEFQARYPGRYSLRSLDTLQRRVRTWRRQEVERLICDLKLHTRDTAIPLAPE